MAVNVDILNVNELYINGVNLLEGKRDYIQLVGDEKVVINVPTGSTTYSKAIPQSGVNLGDVELKAIPLDLGTLDDINDGGGLGVDSTYKNVDSSGVSYFSNVNIDNFLINKVRTIKSVTYNTYTWDISHTTKTLVHSGTAIDSELKFSDYLVSYNAQIDPWVAVVPTITTTTSPFTLIETSALTSNTFTTTQSFNIGDVVSSDMETFGTVIFKEQDEYMVDADIFYDGVQEKVLEKSDVNKINFVQDKRSGVYTNGLKDALLSSTSSTIYGHINDEIIVDAGAGGHFNIGTMYTMGGYNDTDTTSQFNISVSDDGITYTVIYENLENLMNNHSHTMTGTGRFIKITFLNEIGTWGRIITNFVDGKWWDLSIVHPQSKVYTYSTKLEVNGKSIVPNYIEWFDNMTINKIVCGKVFINPTTVLNIKTENISKVELDLWKEVKGVL